MASNAKNSGVCIDEGKVVYLMANGLRIGLKGKVISAKEVFNKISSKGDKRKLRKFLFLHERHDLIRESL